MRAYFYFLTARNKQVLLVQAVYNCFRRLDLSGQLRFACISSNVGAERFHGRGTLQPR